MDGPSRNLDKANFSPKKKGKQCAAFGCSNTFYGPNGLPSSFHFFKFMHRGMYFCLVFIVLYLSYSLWIMDEGDYCCKISTNFQLGTWIVLSSIEFFLFQRLVNKFSTAHLWYSNPLWMPHGTLKKYFVCFVYQSKLKRRKSDFH